MNFSLIIPLHNEEDNIAELLGVVSNALDSNKYLEDYEVICIDDNSKDSTLKKLQENKTEKVKVFSLARQLGQSGAIAAGLKKAQYEFIGVMDGDLQNDPFDFEKLISKLNEGYDFVGGARFERKDNFKKKLSTKIARVTRQMILKDRWYDITCPIKVFRRECFENFTFFNTFHRFMPYLAEVQGFKATEIGVNHYPRKAGKSKYGMMNRLWVGIKSAYAVKWMRENYLDIKFKDL